MKLYITKNVHKKGIRLLEVFSEGWNYYIFRKGNDYAACGLLEEVLKKNCFKTYKEAKADAEIKRAKRIKKLLNELEIAKYMEF